MTPSEKPDSSTAKSTNEAESTSVITQEAAETPAQTAPQPRGESTPDSAVDESDVDSAASVEGASSAADTEPTGDSADAAAAAGPPPPWQRGAVKPSEQDGAGDSTSESATGRSFSATAVTALSGSSNEGTSSSESGWDSVPGLGKGTHSEASTDRLGSGSTAVTDQEQTQKIPRPIRTFDPGSPSEDAPVDSGLGTRGSSGASAFGTGATTTRGISASATAAGASRRPNRGPRRASLQVKRVDPWSVLKLSLALSIALFFVWMIAVAVLYGVLDGMGVWDSLNGTFTELTSAEDVAAEPLISATRVFGMALIIGAMNIVLVTALATVAAFIYNVAADLAGGVEVTLSEKE